MTTIARLGPLILAPTLLLQAAAVLAQDEGVQEHIDRMTQEHAEDSPTPTEATVPAPSVPVSGESVVYATVGDQAVTGYLARPEGAEGPLPGLVVIHEWWGLNDNIRRMADRLAGEGYVALAVDLYNGTVAETPEVAREAMTAAQADEAAMADNMRQAIAYLRAAGTPKVGVVGWCFGGGVALRTSMAAPQHVDATVIYYGHLVTDPVLLAPLDMPILGLFGGEDQGIPIDSVRAFEAALAELGKPAEVHVYEGAGHAFANPSGHNYQAEAAQDAWQRTVAFLGEHLR